MHVRGNCRAMTTNVSSSSHFITPSTISLSHYVWCICLYHYISRNICYQYHGVMSLLNTVVWYVDFPPFNSPLPQIWHAGTPYTHFISITNVKNLSGRSAELQGPYHDTPPSTAALIRIIRCNFITWTKLVRSGNSVWISWKKKERERAPNKNDLYFCSKCSHFPPNQSECTQSDAAAVVGVDPDLHGSGSWWNLDRYGVWAKQRCCVLLQRPRPDSKNRPTVLFGIHPGYNHDIW